MTLETLLAFTAAMLLLSLTPGPGWLAVVARALSDGFLSGLVAIAGLVLGDLVYLLLAIAGLNVLAAVMGELFLVVEILAALYLVWLGARTWRSKPPERGVAVSRQGGTLKRSFAVGFFVTLGNIKTILFYIALVPTFVDVARLTVADICTLAAIVALVSLLVLGSYAWLAERAGRMLMRPGLLRHLNRLTGGLLVGAGIAVATRS